MAEKVSAGGRVKIRLASNDGVNVVEVEGPSSEAQGLADSAIRLWRFLGEDAAIRRDRSQTPDQRR